MEGRYDGRSGCGPMTMALPAVLLMIACGISEVGTWNGDALDDADDGLYDGTGGVCYVTGVEYPGGHDWQNTESGTSPRCSLVVFADAVPALKLPVGDGYEISPDPDSHILAEGHLYTYFSKNGTTVLKRNGESLCRYNGDEVLSDMLVIEGNVHTLATRRSGGFVYRVNGEALVERLSGDLFGRLWRDGDEVCFAFSHPVVHQEGLDTRYYLAVGSNLTAVRFDKEVEKVWDIRSRKGVPVCLVSSLRWGSVMLYEGDGRKEITLPPESEMLSCTMFSADSLIGVECVYSYEDGSCESGIWVEGAEYIRFETGRSIFALDCSDGQVCCVLNPEDDRGIIFDAGDLYDMPHGYSCIGTNTVAVYEGEMHVAMTSNRGEKPIIWHGGITDTLKMNGYVCSISFSGGQTTRSQ